MTKPIKAHFCFECGAKLKMGYPGGDPENGPAQPLCPNGHDTVEDTIDEHRWDTFRGCLQEIVDAPCYIHEKELDDIDPGWEEKGFFAEMLLDHLAWEDVEHERRFQEYWDQAEKEDSSPGPEYHAEPDYSGGPNTLSTVWVKGDSVSNEETYRLLKSFRDSLEGVSMIDVDPFHAPESIYMDVDILDVLE